MFPKVPNATDTSVITWGFFEQTTLPDMPWEAGLPGDRRKAGATTANAPHGYLGNLVRLAWKVSLVSLGRQGRFSGVRPRLQKVGELVSKLS